MTVEATRRASDDTLDLPVITGHRGHGELDRVASPNGLQSAYGQVTIGGGHWNNPSQTGMVTIPLAAAALLDRELPRPKIPDWVHYPSALNLWPTLGAAAWSGLGFWANTEPDHGYFAAVFLAIGAGLGAAGATATLASNLTRSSGDDEAQTDQAGARLLLGGAVAALSGAAATGAGLSGIGVMGTVATMVVGTVASNAVRHHRRQQQRDFLVGLTAASNPGAPIAMLPMPPGLPHAPAANPYQARVLAALEAMRIEGALCGVPKEIAADTWAVKVELPAGANNSPQALAKDAKVKTLANNLRARRVEVVPLHGNIIELTVFDGADQTAEHLPWDGRTVASIREPVPFGIDDIGQDGLIDLTGRTLVAGSSGSGKSHFLNTLLCATLPAEDLVRIGIDCKPGAPELGPYEKAFHYLAGTARDAMRVQYGIKELIRARGAILGEASSPEEWESRPPVREWSSEFGPYILITTDELAELTREYPKIARVMESNRQLGRYVGVFFLDGTQTPSAAVFGDRTDARQQYDVRVGLRMTEATGNSEVFGPGMQGKGWRLEDIADRGIALVYSTRYRQPRPRRVCYVGARDVLDMVEAWASRVRSMDETSARALEEGMAGAEEAYRAEPGPGGRPSGPGRGRAGTPADAIDVAQEYWGAPPDLHLVPTYPNGAAMDAKLVPLWDAFKVYGEDGALASDLVSLQLDGFTSESQVRKVLRFWEARGHVEAVKEGRAQRFWVDGVRSRRRA